MLQLQNAQRKKTHLFSEVEKKQQPYGGAIQETERVIAAKTNVFLPSTTAGKLLEFLLEFYSAFPRLCSNLFVMFRTLTLKQLKATKYTHVCNPVTIHTEAERF